MSDARTSPRTVTHHILAETRRFRGDERGTVTVDWVVLTALIIGVGFAAGALIWGRTETVADRVGTFVGAQDVNDTPD